MREMFRTAMSRMLAKKRIHFQTEISRSATTQVANCCALGGKLAALNSQSLAKQELRSWHSDCAQPPNA